MTQFVGFPWIGSF